MKFIIIHGAFGSKDGNWLPQLKEKLESLGQSVLLPQFPVDKWGESGKQNLKSWFKTFEKEILPNIKTKEKLCFVGHSLGPLFILHIVEKYHLKLDSAIFVGPFMDKLNRHPEIDLVNKTFYKTDFDFDKLKKLIPVSYVLHSDNDPYVAVKHSMLFAKAMESSIIFVKKAGHMNSEVNLNEFPLVFDLCNTRLDLSIYQKYIVHRNNYLDYISHPNVSLLDLKMEIKPDEIYDEGRFKFRNLKEGGFCTFPTGFKGWDPTNPYSVECRKAAKRVKISRVFLVESMSDLKKLMIKKQMKLDFENGVKIGVCLFTKVKNQLPKPSFGVWDDEYVCIENYHSGKVIDQIELNSTGKMMKEAQKWGKIVMDNTTMINNYPEDVEKFIKENQ